MIDTVGFIRTFYTFQVLVIRMKTSRCLLHLWLRLDENDFHRFLRDPILYYLVKPSRDGAA
jgi:hypothetical protein